MKKYYLKNKSGEIINTVLKESLQDAIQYFATIKAINTIDLLAIYDVS